MPIERLLRHLDEQGSTRDDPLASPGWAGPPDTDEPEIKITLRGGKALLKVSPAFAEAVRAGTAPTSALERLRHAWNLMTDAERAAFLAEVAPPTDRR